MWSSSPLNSRNSAPKSLPPANQQDDLHRVGVLADERTPAGLGLPGVELVRAEALGAREHLGGTQALLRIDVFGLEDQVGAERVPCVPVGVRRRARGGCP